VADRHNRDLDRIPAPQPEPLPVATVDSHAHLEIVTNAAPDSAEVGKVLDDARAAGIDRVVHQMKRRLLKILNTIGPSSQNLRSILVCEQLVKQV